MAWNTLPNIITTGRISLVPIFAICFYLGGYWLFPVAFLIFLISVLSDWLDGYLARKLEQTTSFGAFLDPLADKFIVVIALILLIEERGVWYFTIPAAIIILREIVVSGLREWMAELNLRSFVAVSNLGKVKTAMQMIAILLFLFRLEILAINISGMAIYKVIVEFSSYICFYVAAVLSLWSMAKYMLSAAIAIKRKN